MTERQAPTVRQALAELVRWDDRAREMGLTDYAEGSPRGKAWSAAREALSHPSPDGLVERLRDEADLCRNEGATDIAHLLDEAAAALESPRGAEGEIAAHAHDAIWRLLRYMGEANDGRGNDKEKIATCRQARIAADALARIAKCEIDRLSAATPVQQPTPPFATLWQHGEEGRLGVEFDGEPRSYSHMAGWQPVGRLALIDEDTAIQQPPKETK